MDAVREGEVFRFLRLGRCAEYQQSFTEQLFSRLLFEGEAVITEVQVKNHTFPGVALSGFYCNMDVNICSSHDSPTSPAEAEDLLMEISTILNTGLDRASLRVLLKLLEEGVHPEALARVALELDRELLNVKHKEERVGSSTAQDAP